MPGTGELSSLEMVPEAFQQEQPPLQLAIAGVPNVGKSTLVNALLGAERVLTGPEPGLTRDSVRVRIVYEGKPIWLVRPPSSCVSLCKVLKHRHDTVKGVSHPEHSVGGETHLAGEASSPNRCVPRCGMILCV